MAARLAAMDQVSAGCRDLAALVATYYRTLLDDGVPAERAFELADTYQASLLAYVFFGQVINAALGGTGE